MAKKKIDKDENLVVNETDRLRELINKKAGKEVAMSIDDTLSSVTEWIPTGSHWLDCTIRKGGLGGIPVGRIIEIFGDNSAGKSFLCLSVGANALKLNHQVFIFDSEAAADKDFYKGLGIGNENVQYIQPDTVEETIMIIEVLLNDALERGPSTRYTFIWDSVATTPSAQEDKADMEDLGNHAHVKAKVLKAAMRKISRMVNKTQSTLVITNHLINNLQMGMGPNRFANNEDDKKITPAGTAIPYAASLRLKMTKRRNKDSKILSKNGIEIGFETRIELFKTRMGTDHRVAVLAIIFGGKGDAHLSDEGTWFEALTLGKCLKQAGAWYTIPNKDGTELVKFQGKDSWFETLQDPKVHARVKEMIYEEYVERFANEEGDASNFYKLEDE
jgi:recombination protein RecA